MIQELPDFTPRAHTAPIVRPPRGEITELVGRLGSGRTSLFTAWLAEITAGGSVAALVDVDDTFDPISARRAGLDLRRVLWARCGGSRDLALRATDLLVRCPGFALVGIDTGEVPPRLTPAAAFRLKLAARRSDIALVIVARRRIAGSSAALAIETIQDEIHWSGPGSRSMRLDGMCTNLQLLRLQHAVHARVSGDRWPQSVRWSA